MSIGHVRSNERRTHKHTNTIPVGYPAQTYPEPLISKDYCFNTVSVFSTEKDDAQGAS